MILIWDNGGCYSDHEVYFYDCEDWPLEDVKALASMLREITSGGSLVGIVREIEWEGYVQKPHEALDPLAWIEAPHSYLEEKHAAVLRRCMPEVLEKAVRGAERDRSVPAFAARLPKSAALVAKILELTSCREKEEK